MSLFHMNKRMVLKLIFLILIFTIIVIIGVKTAPWLFEHARNPEYIRTYLAGFGNIGFLVYMLIQTIQVVIVIIPGDIVSACGGFVYGIPIGFMLSYTGLMIGSVIVFYISRILGYELVSIFLSEQKIDKISDTLNSSKGTVGLFIICCIPFIPKDIMMYIAGLTPVKAPRLFVIYGISRVPSVLIWVSVGANAFEKNILGLVVTISILIIMIILLYFLNRYYQKNKNSMSENNPSTKI